MTNNKIAARLLKEQIKEHNDNKCRCDLSDGGYGLCYAGQWLAGIITSKDVIENIKGASDDKL